MSYKRIVLSGILTVKARILLCYFQAFPYFELNPFFPLCNNTNKAKNDITEQRDVVM